MDLREIGWEVMNWIDLAQDRDQWTDLLNAYLTTVKLYKFKLKAFGSGRGLI